MYLITVVCLTLLDGVAHRAGNFTMLMMRALVTTSCITYVRRCGVKTARLTDPLTLISDGGLWPKDMRTAIEALEIDPETVVMACCRACRAIYPPDSNSKTPYPVLCTNRIFPDEPECGEELTKQAANGDQVPIYPFLHQPMESWLNNVMSRQGFVEEIKKVSNSWSEDQGPTGVRDMLFGETLQTLRGHDGQPFMKAPPGELRLAFTLNVDWFNPFGRRTAGKHASVGGVYMVCMNLPIHLRYLVENVYLVGIIPGPNEPTVDQINFVFKPLVDSLLRFWNPGVFFSWTSSHSGGCLVRAVVAALVCDIIGMRKSAGFAGATANLFCSFCYLNRNDVHNIDRETWEPRTRQRHMEDALRYKRAADAFTQKKEFEQNGVRWSEFLRLPYWNPLEFAVVDSMHNLFLNNCKHHCRNLWGMDSEVAPHKKTKPHDTAAQEKNIEIVRQAIEQGDSKTMNKARKTYIVAFALANKLDISPKKTKAEIVAELLKWVSLHISSNGLHSPLTFHIAEECKPKSTIECPGCRSASHHRIPTTRRKGCCLECGCPRGSHQRREAYNLTYLDHRSAEESWI